MPDRHATPSSNHAEMLDQWLDALNDTNGSTPAPPEEIGDLAAIARDYRQVLGAAPATTTVRSALPERNGSMNHALPTPIPTSGPWETVRPRRHRQRTSRPGWLTRVSNGLATAVVVGLLIALIGGTVIRQTGFPNSGYDPAGIAGVAASPQTTPAGDALTCGAPGYRPIIAGDVDAGELAMLGVTGEPIIRNGATTLTAANGTDITLPADARWSFSWHSDVILSRTDDAGGPDTVISPTTGESWTFPDINRGANNGGDSGFVLIGPWLFGVTDHSMTDWQVINTQTGETRLTSDIFDARFDHARTPDVSTLAYPGDTAPVIISFETTSESDSDDASGRVLVLPSSDLTDAWALDDEYAMAAQTDVITLDGSRIAYLHSDGGENTIRVLDGFTGNLVADYPAPGFDEELIVAGLASDDTTLILHDSHQVWTVALDSGEATVAFAPDSPIQSFDLDNETRNALIGVGEHHAETLYWLHPATGETRKVEAPDSPMRAPTPQFGWALVQTRQDTSTDTGFALLDMATGKITTEITAPATNRFGSAYWISGNGPENGGVFVVQSGDGTLTVLDGPSGRSFTLPVPFQTDQTNPWSGVAVGISPNHDCIVITRVERSGDEPGTSWIAPLQPDADWTRLPFALSGWTKIPSGEAAAATRPRANPAQDASTPVATPAPSALAALLPNNVIPILEPDAPESVAASRAGTVGAGGLTIPLGNGDTWHDPDAVRIAQAFFTDLAIVEMTDGSRISLDLATGETLAELPAQSDREWNAGPFLFTPANEDMTDWTIIDVRTGERTDTSAISGGEFADAVIVRTAAWRPDAPERVVAQFLLADTVAGASGPAPYQGLATETGPVSGTLVIPGDLDDAHFLEGSIGSSAPVRHPSAAISAGEEPLVAWVTSSSDARIRLANAVIGETIATWPDYRGTHLGKNTSLAGFTPDGQSLIVFANIGGGTVRQLSWTDSGASAHNLEVEEGYIDRVIPVNHGAMVKVRDETSRVPAANWKLLDLETGAWTDLPGLDGARLDRFYPGSPWMVFRTASPPASSGTVIVDPADGSIAAKLVDADLGRSTALSPARDFGVIVITGHTGDETSTGYVIDAERGESWAITPPAEGNIFYQVSPDGSLLNATRYGDNPDSAEDATAETWIAPVAPDAGWISIDNRTVSGWLVYRD